MLQEQSLISAQELFGSGSYLTPQSAEVANLGIASLGTSYQIATGVVALLFIFIFVRYFELIRHLVFSYITSRMERTNMHTYSAEINNIEIFTALAGVSLLALFVMRLSIVPEAIPYLAPMLTLPPWGIGGVVLGGTLALILFERISLYVVGAVSKCLPFCKSIWQAKMLHFSTTIVFLSPMLILSLLTAGGAAKVALIVSIIICSLSLILFIKETFSLFRAQRFSIFHWILYLCALEIFPLSLLLAPIARG